MPDSTSIDTPELPGAATLTEDGGDPAGMPDPFTAVAPGERHAAYRVLAADDVPRRIATPGGGVAWLITSYGQVRQAMADPRLVKALSPTTTLTQKLVPDMSAGLVTHMLRLDPPDHTRLRKLVGAVFTRRRVEHLGPRIQEVADTLLDRMSEAAAASPGQTFDFIGAYANPLPMVVICEMIGLPEDKREDFRQWTGTLLKGHFADPDEFAEAARRFLGYLRQLVADKRRNPGDDVLSALISVREDGDRLSEDELTSMVWLLVVGGHETTANVITSALHALLTHPDQLDRLRSHPELIDTAIEEVLRTNGSLHTALPMRATGPIELGGVTFAADDVVVASLMAANHDAGRFADPERFDVGRTDNSHVSFGHGIHHCIGAHLGRLEARVAVSALLSRFPDIRLAVPAVELRWRENLLMHGLTTMPVTLEAAKASVSPSSSTQSSCPTGQPVGQ